MSDASAPQSSPDASSEQKSELSAVGFIPFAIAGGVVAYAVESVRNFIYEWRFPLAIAAAVVIVVFLIIVLMPSGRRWLNESKPTTRAGLFIFLVLPSLIGVVVGVATLPKDYQVTAVRAVFLVVVCILPATMWYLFLVTRKASLLNEFLANLHRLGLLRIAFNEDEASRARRVQSYLQKFEAIYGDLPASIHDDVLSNNANLYSRSDTSAGTTLSTATVPVMLSTVLIALGWLITLPPAHVDAPPGTSIWLQALKLDSSPVTFAFLGAYFFALQLLFRRYVLKDLGGSAYVAVSIRIILAVIGIWVVSAVSGVEENKLLVAGFVFGVFPRVVWQIVSSVFKKAAGIALPSMISQLPVSDLDGLTVWHEARLEEEDIENIPNMATADLVELLLNTRFPPERIIDWADQAILYTQLGPQEQKKGELNARDRLRLHGIRTATSLLRVSESERREAFDNILTDDNGRSLMPTLKASLATNSNLYLIQRWRSTSDPRPAGESAFAPHPGQGSE
jgi:hypothetical protein